MDASSTRPARSVAAGVRVRGSAGSRPSAQTEVVPTRAVAPSSALDNSHQDLDRRSSGSEREASQPLTDPVGRALLDVLASEGSQHQADMQSALLRAKAYARTGVAPMPRSTSGD